MTQKSGFKNRSNLIKVVLINLVFAIPLAYCILDFFTNTKNMLFYIAIIILAIFFESIIYVAVFKSKPKELKKMVLTMDIVSIVGLFLCGIILGIFMVIWFMIHPVSICC